MIVEGVVFLLGRYRYRCAECVPDHVRERPTVVCECCDRPLVVVHLDRRFRHIVCSEVCQRELRARVRHIKRGERECPGCGGLFVPGRADQVCCKNPCRTRLWRQRNESHQRVAA